MSSILKVDTINENSSGGGVTIDGLKIKDVSAGSTMSKPILQIVTGTTTTDTGATATTSYTDTGLSASITPTSTSSKIMVLVSQTMQVTRDGGGEMVGRINIMRATTEIGEWYFVAPGDGKRGPLQTSIAYVDSPSTTSATTYKTQMKGSTTDNSGSVRANQQAASGESTSSIHLIEIAG